MISDYAYAEGSNAAWGTFTKVSIALPANVKMGPGVTKRPRPPAAAPPAGAVPPGAPPAAPPPGAPPGAPAAPAAPPGAPAAPPAGQPGIGSQIWSGFQQHVIPLIRDYAAARAANPVAAPAAAAAPAKGGFMQHMLGGAKGDPAHAGTWGHAIGGQIPGIGMAYAMSKLQGGGTPDNGLGG